MLRFADEQWLGAGHFSADNAERRFTYAWSADAQTLTLRYVNTADLACTVTVTFTLTDSNEIDTQLTLMNQSEREIELLSYPFQLAFKRVEIKAVFVPYIEGMRLLPSFFEEHTFSAGYPGPLFADFAYADLSSGTLAVYGVQKRSEPLMPSFWLLMPEAEFAGGVYKIHHDFTLAVKPGETWTSPTVVLSVGAALQQAMDAYWQRNGHDQMPTLVKKLGPDLFAKLSRAVLLKQDFFRRPPSQRDEDGRDFWTFKDFQRYLPNIPAGTLLHLVVYWPKGFDQHYPDYLPPDERLGRLADLQQLVAQARKAGYLVMPYTNPTWWDERSETMQKLGEAIAARDRAGQVVRESYGPNAGIVVSPQTPKAIARHAQTLTEFTQTVPCDLLFEDQLGARGQPLIDTHPTAPSKTYFMQGLVDVAQRSAWQIPIMTESGFDRLAWFESGFCNSHTVGWHPWPKDTYRTYPMTPLWAHENLYFTGHNLAGATMTLHRASLTDYLSKGYSLSYDLFAGDMVWLRILACYQQHLVAPLIGMKMSSYEELQPVAVTRTSFANGTQIIANQTNQPHNYTTHVIAPEGFLALNQEHLLGGVLSQLYGKKLTGDEPHYLLFEYAPEQITLYQLLGDDGPLTLPRPEVWTDESRLKALAITTSGQSLTLPLKITANRLTIAWLNTIDAQPIDHIQIIYHK